MDGSLTHYVSNTDDLLPLLLFSLPISFLLSFGIGANDVGNSFGTAYGSGVLTLRQCCILACIFESAGAVLLGSNVSETIRKGIFDVSCYDREEHQLSLGYFSALIGAGIWNLLASMMRLPVSGTHSILGSLLGFTLVAKHLEGIKWKSIASVVASWFISPMASGAVTAIGYYFLHKYILSHPREKRTSILLALLPTFFAVTFWVNIFSIVYKGAPFLSPFYRSSPYYFPYAIGVSTFIAVIVWFSAFLIWVPKQKDILRRMANPGDTSLRGVTNKGHTIDDTAIDGDPNPTIGTTTGTTISPGTVITTENNNNNNNNNNQIHKKDDPESTIESVAEHQDFPQDPPEVVQIFKALQILTSCIGSFAHGANDVSNAIGPLIALYLIQKQGHVYQEGTVPIYLLMFGGLGISVGLWVLGYRVIQTIGRDLTKVTPSTGFLIEFCSSFTALFASKFGFPISTTHCEVGSVVAVGWIRRRMNPDEVVPSPEVYLKTGEDKEEDDGVKVGRELKPKKKGVNWNLCIRIGTAWVLTVPAAASITAFSFWSIREVFPMFQGSEYCTNPLVVHHG